MSLGPPLISTPCSFSSKPLIHFTCQVPTTPIIHHLWIMSRIYSNPSGIYPYICTCISSWQSYPNNSNHKWVNTQPNTTLPRPIPRSGWRVSLRRDILAQASPLRLGEGSKRASRSNAGSRLGETPLAWARCSLAQKFERVAWATSRTNWCGRAFVRLA